MQQVGASVRTELWAEDIPMTPSLQLTVLSLTKGWKPRTPQHPAGEVSSVCVPPSSLQGSTPGAASSTLGALPLCSELLSDEASCPRPSHPIPCDAGEMCQFPNPKISHHMLFIRICCPVKRVPTGFLPGKWPAEHGQCLGLDYVSLGYKA